MCPTCRFPTEVVSMAMSALLICKQSTGSRPPKALDPAIGPIENLVRKCARSMHASIGLPLSAAAALHTSAHGLSIPSQLATLTSACTIASSFQYQKTKPGRLYDSKAVKAQCKKAQVPTKYVYQNVCKFIIKRNAESWTTQY